MPEGMVLGATLGGATRSIVGSVMMYAWSSSIHTAAAHMPATGSAKVMRDAALAPPSRRSALFGALSLVVGASLRVPRRQTTRGSRLSLKG